MPDPVQNETAAPALESLSADELRRRIEAFPYVAVYRMLLARRLKETGDPDYRDVLQQAALYAPDRVRLYRLLNPSADATLQAEEKARVPEQRAEVPEEVDSGIPDASPAAAADIEAPEAPVKDEVQEEEVPAGETSMDAASDEEVAVEETKVSEGVPAAIPIDEAAAEDASEVEEPETAVQETASEEIDVPAEEEVPDDVPAAEEAEMVPHDEVAEPEIKAEPPSKKKKAKKSDRSKTGKKKRKKDKKKAEKKKKEKKSPDKQSSGKKEKKKKKGRKSDPKKKAGSEMKLKDRLLRQAAEHHVSLDEKHTFLEWLDMFDGETTAPPAADPLEAQLERHQAGAVYEQEIQREAEALHRAPMPGEPEGEDLPEIRALADRSVAMDAGFASETLAGIMLKQGKIAEAIRVYEALALKNPEKSDYFAALIKQLKSR